MYKSSNITQRPQQLQQSQPQTLPSSGSQEREEGVGVGEHLYLLSQRCCHCWGYMGESSLLY